MLHYEMKNTFKNSCLQKKICEEGSVCELCASFIKLISVIHTASSRGEEMV